MTVSAILLSGGRFLDIFGRDISCIFVDFCSNSLPNIPNSIARLVPLDAKMLINLLRGGSICPPCSGRSREISSLHKMINFSLCVRTFGLDFTCNCYMKMR